MRKVNTVVIAVLLVTLTACSSVTIRTDGGPETTAEPTFQKRFSYWWWGLSGEHTVNVREICQGRKVEQMQAVGSVVDVMATLLTLGVYIPRTARVWCEEDVNNV